MGGLPNLLPYRCLSCARCACCVPWLPQLADPAWMKYILPKGFVSVDGCSLTVGETTADGFSVYLIPETLRCVNAGVAPPHHSSVCLPRTCHACWQTAGAECHALPCPCLPRWCRVTVAGIKGEGDEASEEGAMAAGWRAWWLGAGAVGSAAVRCLQHRPLITMPDQTPPAGHTPVTIAPHPCHPRHWQVNVEVETQTQAIVDTVERVLQKYVAEGRLPALPQQ